MGNIDNDLFYHGAHFVHPNIYNSHKVRAFGSRRDIAIIETGIGGRFDATNIITPLLSIITSIERDHTPILGNTLEEIALEKSGIIKPGVPVVIGEKAAFMPIMAKACGLYITKNDSQKFLELLPFHLKSMEGLTYFPPCRYEVHGDLILDVDHNPSALMHLFKRVKKDFPGRKIEVLFGMSKDKDIPAALEVVQSYVDQITFLSPTHPRLFPFSHCMSAKEALSKKKIEGSIRIATGSFYIMKELLLLLASEKSRQ